jgi:deoxyadenosine/deoxycytidine kinase
MQILDETLFLAKISNFVPPLKHHLCLMNEPAKPSIKHVAIAGNIGAGKTTLCSKLARHFGWDTHFESTDDNPYLADFYHDMQRWSFNLQIYFLNNRYQQVLKILQGDRTVIQDRTIYEDAFIFAPTVRERDSISGHHNAERTRNLRRR